jgi:hypothetical protein
MELAQRFSNADAHVADRDDGTLIRLAASVQLRGHKAAGGRPGMLDHVEAELTRRFVQLRHDLTIGIAD